jgi:FMN-dependent oxidoreductase (nitrilotriacetate monooxygenase family)
MHLLGFMINSPMNHTILTWAHPKSRQGAEFPYPEFWQEIARTLERGRFDGLFLADSFAPYDIYRDSVDPAIRYGVICPQHDPVPLVPVMALATRHLGFAVTMSTNAYPPYVLARTMASLDHLTRGRVGWNLVTGVNRAEFRNLGLPDYVPHDERYDRADEYLELCDRLWQSWEPEAVVMDCEAGVYADPTKVHRVNFEGKYFASVGPLVAMASPQRRPPIFQAGSSGRGRDFAARQAEVVFAIQAHPKAMRAYADDLRQRAATFGRGRQALKIMFGVQVFVGESEAAAREQYEAMMARIPLEAALARLSGSFGFDFSRVDLDQPLEYVRTEASQGLYAALTTLYGAQMTVRQAAMRWGASIGMPQIVGSPAQVADALQTMLEEGGGDGFNLTPTYTPGSFVEFVNLVVPILQRRGALRTEYRGRTFREHIFED